MGYTCCSLSRPPGYGNQIFIKVIIFLELSHSAAIFVKFCGNISQLKFTKAVYVSNTTLFRLGLTTNLHVLQNTCRCCVMIRP